MDLGMAEQCSTALLGRGSNRQPSGVKAEALTSRPRGGEVLEGYYMILTWVTAKLESN